MAHLVHESLTAVKNGAVKYKQACCQIAQILYFALTS